MSLAPLYPLTNQFQGDGGENLVGGFLKVYYNGTDDIAETFADAAGEALNPSPIILDNNGMASVWVDASRIYRLEVYYRSGRMCYARYPVIPVGSGEGGLADVDITSTDGSVSVTRTQIGSSVNFDLSTEGHATAPLWVKCAGASAQGSRFIPVKESGTLEMDGNGILLPANSLYHVTARFLAEKSAVQPYYDNLALEFRTYDGETGTAALTVHRIVDGSMAIPQEFEAACDIRVASSPVSLAFAYSGKDMDGYTVSFLSCDVHQVGGVPAELP